MLLPMRRRASSLPRLCGRSTSMGCVITYTVGLRSALFKRLRMALWFPRCFPPRFHSAAAAPLQAQPAPAPPPCNRQRSRSAAWNPAAPYITPGQDEPGYRTWYLADPSRPAQVKAFNDYLVSGQCRWIAPDMAAAAHRDSWKDCGAQPFEVPPSEQWAAHGRKRCATSTTMSYPRSARLNRFPATAIRPQRLRGRGARKRAQAWFARSTSCRYGRSTARR